MSEQRPSMFVPALIGGGVAGVLSAIPFINCLCCLWIIGGAMLAAHLLAKDSVVPLNAGDGAVVGALTGLIATFVDTIVSIPFTAMSNEFMQSIMDRFAEYADEVPEGFEQFFEGGFEASGPWMFFGILIVAVIFVALGTLGGVIGISLFGKKTAVQQEGDSAPPQDPGHS